MKSNVVSIANTERHERISSLYKKHVNSGYAKLASLMNLPTEYSSAGVYVYDQDGNRYLDAGGYGVFLLGHGHPKIVAAVQEQLHKNALASKLLLNGEQAEAAAALAEHCPGDLQYVYFCNSGTEATEAALKLARLNNCTTVISTNGGYHGKTLGALSVTGRDKYRESFQSMLNDTHFVTFGDTIELQRTLSATNGRACVILEPVQAEAGVIIPPPNYLRDVRSLCNEFDAILIFDEIQSGMGRTGYWWACERENVAPDILLAGKSLSGGCIPVSAMIATATVYEPFNRNPLIHTSTFGGNPIAMAAVSATIACMDSDRIIDRVRNVGEFLQRHLTEILESVKGGEHIRLRCAGLLIGLEFPESSQAADMVMALLRENLIVCHSLNDHRTIRLTPSALLTRDDCDFMLSAIRRALQKTFSRNY